jgi:hypothetical protein
VGRRPASLYANQKSPPILPLPLQATHIFDGLESWPSHVMYLARGRLQIFEPAARLPELRDGRLLELVER